MGFKRHQDPLKALNIGYGDKVKTNAWKILEFIRNIKSTVGGTQTFIIETNRTYPYMDLNMYTRIGVETFVITCEKFAINVYDSRNDRGGNITTMEEFKKAIKIDES